MFISTTFAIMVSCVRIWNPFQFPQKLQIKSLPGGFYCFVWFNKDRIKMLIKNNGFYVHLTKKNSAQRKKTLCKVKKGFLTCGDVTQQLLPIRAGTKQTLSCDRTPSSYCPKIAEAVSFLYCLYCGYKPPGAFVPFKLFSWGYFPLTQIIKT